MNRVPGLSAHRNRVPGPPGLYLAQISSVLSRRGGEAMEYGRMYCDPSKVNSMAIDCPGSNSKQSRSMKRNSNDRTVEERSRHRMTSTV